MPAPPQMPAQALARSPQAASKVLRAQSWHAPQAVATSNSSCSSSKLEQPLNAWDAIWDSVTRWQTQTIMVGTLQRAASGAWVNCNATHSHLQAH